MIQTNLKLRSVAEMLSEPEARVEECVLGMEGIPCLLTNTGTVGLYEVFGVTVEVADGNWKAAQEVLHEMHEHHEHRQGEPSWNCAACGTDVDADFDTCWQCGDERPSPKSLSVAIDQTTAVTAPENLSAKSLTAGAETSLEEPADSRVARAQLWDAWRAAVGGLLLPLLFLSVYSLRLLFRINFAKLPTGQGGKLIATFGLALLGLCLSLAYFSACCRLF